MAAIPVPDTVGVQMLMSYIGQQVENTFNYTVAGPITAATLEDIATQFQIAWNANVQPLQVGAVTYRAVRVTDLSSTSGPVYELPISGSGGGINNAGLPSNVTFSVKRSTTKRGRSYRGRVYFIGLDASQTGNDGIASNYADAIVAALNNLREDMLSQSAATEVIVSRQEDKVPLTVGVTTPVVQYGYADLYLDSQRRRLPGRGR